MAFIAFGCAPDLQSPPRTELSVFAASSLTDAFEALERGFERANPDMDVRLTFAGSQVLRLQLEQGAAADVFASANEAHMRALVDAKVVSSSRTFAHNELVVVVPSSNPAAIHAFEDLPRAARLVIGTDNVPVGAYARQVFDRARSQLGNDFTAQLEAHVVSEESNTRLVRAKVELGEADAAIVYRTDAAVSERLRVIPIPNELNVRAGYPVGVVARSQHSAMAMRFIDYVLSEQGQSMLVDFGFMGATQ